MGVVAVIGANGVAQQGAWLNAAKQLHGRLMKESVGVDQHGFGVAGQHLAQDHMLASKVIAVGLVPGFAGCVIQGVDGYRQVLVRLGAVTVDLDVQGFIRRFSQVGQGADDAELCFLMIGVRPEDQVDELRAG
ncbi:hypothetical protein D9M71_758900 [compost metagenome]